MQYQCFYYGTINDNRIASVLVAMSAGADPLSANFTTYTILSDIGQFLVEKWVFPLSLVSIISNLLVLISSGLILKSKLQPRSTYMFLGNLALADMLHGIIFLFLLTFYPSIKGGFACVNIIGLTGSYVIECSLSVCLIAIDRYIYIHHGLHYSLWMTTKKTRYILLGSWSFSFAVGAIPQMLFANYGTGDEDCSLFEVTPLYLMLAISCAGLIPEISTIILYIFILKTATKAKKAIRLENNRNINQPNVRTRRFSHFFCKDIDNKGTKSASMSQIAIKTNDLFESDSTLIVNSNCSQTAINIENTATVNDCNEKGSEEYFKSDDIAVNNVPFLKEIKDSGKKLGTGKDVKNKQITMKTKSTMIVFLAMFTSTVTWGPCFVCLSLYPILCRNDSDSGVCPNLKSILLFIIINVGLINAVLNPIIYCWWHKGFRKSLANLCFKKAARERRRNDFVLSLRYTW